MAETNKIIWKEGQFIRPQDFQQQDRAFEAQLTQLLGAYDWGLKSLALDKALLNSAQIAITECSGIFPDGTPFHAPKECPPPDILDIDETVRDTIVYLALPLRRPNTLEIEKAGQSNSLTRYTPCDYEVRDNTNVASEPVELQVAQLKVLLMLESQDRSQFSCIPIAKIRECRSDGLLILDEKFLPSCMDCNAHNKLISYAHELRGLLHQRAEMLARHVNDPNRSGVSQITDFMMLELVNEYKEIFGHLCHKKGLHPESLYEKSVALNGRLATYASDTKQPAELPPYRQDDLSGTFAPLMKSLRTALSMVIEQHAVNLELVENANGIQVATLNDRSLLEHASFILAVNASIPIETLRTTFPAQVKIGPVEQIRQLINLQLPGINVQTLPIAPPQIPYHAGYTYFQLDPNSTMWEQMTGSGGFAIHLSGEFPGLQLSFWAIRGKS